MIWWLLGIWGAGLLFAVSLAVIAGRADDRLARMSNNDEYTRGG